MRALVLGAALAAVLPLAHAQLNVNGTCTCSRETPREDLDAFLLPGSACVIVQCSGKNVGGILRIKAHPTISAVDVSSNKLTGINVTDNFVLRSIDAESNGLTSVFIGNASGLGELNMRANALTDFDTAGAPNLLRLSVAANKLTALPDLASSNPALKELFIAGNMIAELELSSLASLEKLHAHYNRLKVVNLADLAELQDLIMSFNTQLTSVALPVNLKSINLEKCKLSALDLTKLADLRSVIVSTNFFETLDLSGNPLLESLVARFNRIKTLDLSAQGPTLTTLHLQGNDLTALDISELTGLTDLELDNNCFVDKVCKSDGVCVLPGSKSSCFDETGDSSGAHRVSSFYAGAVAALLYLYLVATLSFF